MLKHGGGLQPDRHLSIRWLPDRLSCTTRGRLLVISRPPKVTQFIRRDPVQVPVPVAHR
jgi:hypothetical protein